MTKIDIVITTFNRAGQLEGAIRSVLAQEDRNFTLYVLDNRSTDETEAVCQRLLTPPHRYIRNPENYGMVGNWNAALETGSADWVQILHDDDELTPRYVRALRTFVAAHPDCAFVHTAADIIDDAGAVTGQKRHSFPTHVPGDEFFTGWLKGKVDVVCPTALFNRTRLPADLRFSSDLPFTADLIFFLQASAYGAVGYVADPVFRYRQHAGSTTSTLREKIGVKIGDRRAAGAMIQAEIDRRDIAAPSPATTGRRYMLDSLCSDILFTRLLGGGIADVLAVVASVARAEPQLLRRPRFYRMLGTALVPPALLRRAGRLLRRGRGTGQPAGPQQQGTK